jgi:hypothetical protein
VADEIDSAASEWPYDYPPPPPAGASRRQQLEWLAAITTSSNPPWDRERLLAIEEIEHRYPYCED